MPAVREDWSAPARQPRPRDRRALAPGEEPALALDHAILATVTYASLFQFPLSEAELERSLMDVRAGTDAIRDRLERPFLRGHVAVTGGLVHPREREDWTSVREARRRHSRGLVAKHAGLLRLLGAFPFVRLVALSGGCAHDNATDADVDVFLIARRGRAWAVCLALMVLCKLKGARRTLCMNYIVDEEGAALPERDLFTASEIVGMKPLAGREAYRRFVEANSWVSERFPNFFAGHGASSEAVPETAAPRWLEAVLDLGPAQALEALSRWLLGARLRAKTAGRPGVALTPHRLKLHTQDHAHRLLAAFDAALREAEDAAGKAAR